MGADEIPAGEELSGVTLELRTVEERSTLKRALRLAAAAAEQGYVDDYPGELERLDRLLRRLGGYPDE